MAKKKRKKLPKRGGRVKTHKKQYGGGIYSPDIGQLDAADLDRLREMFTNFDLNGATAGTNTGTPSVGGLLGNTNLIGSLTPLLSELVNPNQQSRLNLDQLNDIDRYKVNPTRGFLSFQEGGQAAEPVIPLSALLQSLDGVQAVSMQGLPSTNLTKLGTSLQKLQNGGDVTSQTSDNNFSTVLSSIISQKGGNLNDYEQLMNRIAFHETGPNQRMDPSAKQEGGGPGRGMFMYEPDSLKTAANRYSRFAKKNGIKPPKYIEDIRKGRLKDASKLDPAQQKELFLADMAEHPRAKLQDVVQGRQSLDDFWAKNWWAGPKNLRKKRKTQFNNSQAEFDKHLTEPVLNGGVLPEATVVASPLQLTQPVVQESTAVQPNLLPAELLGTPTQSAVAVNTFKKGGSAKKLVSELGYSRNSPYKNAPFLDIKGNNITMRNTDKDLLLIPNGDTPVLAKARSGEYHFPNSTSVREIPQAQFGGFFKKVGKGIGKVGKAIGNGIKDATLFGADNLTNLLLGIDPIKDSSFSYLGGLSNKTGSALNKVGDFAVPIAATLLNPGLGAAVAGTRGFTNALGDGRNIGQALGAGALNAGGAFLGAKALGSTGGFNNFGNNFKNAVGQQGFLQNILGGGQSQGGLNVGSLLGGAGIGLGVGAVLGGTGAPSTPPFIPQSNVNFNRFGNIFGQFENGGMVNLNLGPFIPIQTEKVGKLPEKFIHLDGTITDVNATETHKQMDDDEVTDLVLQGTYVASATKKMRIDRKDVEDLVIGVKNSNYTEGSVGEIPELLTMADLFKKKKKLTPAEIAESIKRKFPLVHKKEVNDPFTMRTNNENLKARAPYLINLIKLNEKERLGLKSVDEVQIFNPPSAVPAFGNGGVVGKYQGGGNVGNILGVAATALPFLQQIFGNNQDSQRNPLADALALGSIPLAAAGVTANINGRRAGIDGIQSQFDQLNGALTSNFQGLNSDRQRLNQQSLGTNLATTLLQDRRLPRFTADFSRLQNFNTRTPQNFVNSLATPTFDTNSVIAGLGSRGAASFLGNQASNLQRQRNDAALRLFQNQRGQDLSIANSLTTGFNNLSDRNTQLAQQEVGLRNQGINDLGRSFNTFTNNEGNRLTNAFEVTSGLLNNQFQGNANLIGQRSALEGQIALGIAQQLQNGAGILNSFNVPQNTATANAGSPFQNIGSSFFNNNAPALLTDISGRPGLTPTGIGGLTTGGAGLSVPGFSGGSFNILNTPQSPIGQFTSQLPTQSFYNSYNPF